MSYEEENTCHMRRRINERVRQTGMANRVLLVFSSCSQSARESAQD